MSVLGSSLFGAASRNAWRQSCMVPVVKLRKAPVLCSLSYQDVCVRNQPMSHFKQGSLVRIKDIVWEQFWQSTKLNLQAQLSWSVVSTLTGDSKGGINTVLSATSNSTCGFTSAGTPHMRTNWLIWQTYRTFGYSSARVLSELFRFKPSGAVYCAVDETFLNRVTLGQGLWLKTKITLRHHWWSLICVFL